MNEIVNKFLLVGDKFMPEIHLNNLALLTVLVVHSQKTKKELKSLRRLETKTLFIKVSLIRLVFNMRWLTAKQKS